MANPQVAEPQFNIGLVVEETGVPADTLRGWERRYGLPQPDRTDGGHRLYSSQDIDLIHWLVGSKQRGLSISRAVDLWRQRHGAQAAALPLEDQPAPDGDALDELGAAWQRACLDFDEATAEARLAQAFAQYPAEIVVSGLLMPALTRIGAGWQANQISVQQEHFASTLVERRLHTLIAACPPPHRRGQVLAACPAGEQHSLGLLYFSWRLRRAGWGVIYLGQDVPEDRLESMLRRTQPDLVLLTAARSAAVGSLLDLAILIKGLNLPLAYGGRVFENNPGLRAHIPGHYLAGGYDAATKNLFSLLERRGVPKMLSIPLGNQRHPEGLESRLMAISLAVARALSQAPLDAGQIREAGVFWTDNLLTALRFNQMEPVVAELDWVAGWLHRRGLPQGSLAAYLGAYQQVAGNYLEDEYPAEWKQINALLDDYLAKS